MMLVWQSCLERVCERDVCMQVSDQELMDTELRLRSINSLAQVLKAQRADVKADYVLGIGGFDLDRIADEVRAG